MSTLTRVAHHPYASFRAHGRRSYLPPAWPLRALLVLFPLWWVLGLGAFAFPLFAVPMLLELRRRRPLALPPGFLLWALFLALNVLSVVMFPFNPSATTAGSASGRVITLVVNLAEYASATVTMLYLGNLTEAELPQRRVVRMMAGLFVVTVAGGLLGVFLPRFEFTSPLELVLPRAIRTNLYVSALVHPASAQIQSVLGYDAPRPAAPFGYTNFWGNNLSILLVWFVIWGWRRGRARRAAVALVLAVAVLPVVQSLNRGLWLGLGFSAVFAAWRLLRGGKVTAFLGLLSVALAGVIVFQFSPLQATVQARLDNPQSNNLRAFLSAAAIDAAQESPVLGWGGPRRTLGSPQSISVGATPNCPQCGNFPIGSNGQLWFVLVCQGFVGTALFLGFFLFSAVRYSRNATTLSSGAVLVILLTFIYMFFYSSMPAALTLTLISLAVAWREQVPVRSTARSTPTWGRRDVERL